MAHFIVEYSANLRFELDVNGLLSSMHGAIMETNIFPLGGVRLRAVRCEEFLAGDGDPDICFVHVTVKMGHGRPLDVRKAAGEHIFKAVCQVLAPIYKSRPMGISMEMTELDPDLNFKVNNVHDWLKSKEQG